MKLHIESIIDTIESLKQESNYHQARETALDALKKHTDDYRLYEELADIYLFENNLEKADEVLQIARTLHPESGTGMYLDGYIATAKGEFDRAIEALETANKNLPNNAEILRNLGWAYVMKANIPKGIILLRRAHSLAPDEPMIINDLAVALMATGAEMEARNLLQKIGQEALLDSMKNAIN
ncbi:MAG: tetratricopeptide repeat protein [Candidatus Gracilibacteria bacterium]|nr:tetratricopeptide repeat protein [Candidatus Gracilibacteria bacterium]